MTTKKGSTSNKSNNHFEYYTESLLLKVNTVESVSGPCFIRTEATGESAFVPKRVHCQL